ncbi:MAG TPA: ABC-F family ATP-binding cassette domain-containing protein [Spirochaetia bacterium]|nr:ABC-F family ATP-binding cassette domain-containing protein [Spirochaetia bacterium]
MPLVSLSGVCVSFGDRRLLDSVNLTVSTGSRMALVGPNGSGKTTLMRIMAGLSAADTGEVVPEKGTRVSYVPQSGVILSEWTLRQEAEKAFERGRLLQEEIRSLEEKLGALSSQSSSETLLWKHHELQESLEKSGFYRREEAIDRVLGGLGFARDDQQRPCPSFSAGWGMRIALARAILESPDILLLDEPTNYLDIEARAWLKDFLKDFPGGLLLVSHDRWFLDAVVSAVAEIYMARVSVFSGNYSRYEVTRSKELESIMARWQAQQEEIARIEAFIARFRYNASKARLVQSRITALSKMERIETPPVVKSIHFSFPAPPHSGRLVLSCAGLARSYGEHQVFRGLDVEVSRGDKLVVTGVNGAGKSTLLRLLSSREKPDAGEMRWGTGVVPAFYSQENADSWTSGKQVIEELESGAPASLVPELRTLLGAFLFRGDDVFKSVSVLSGGEKSRLALLMLLLRPANLLILDEPTNHLDLASKDVLLAALKEFAGTVIFVSHDRHFISNLATAVLELKDGRARYFPGDYEYYLRRVDQEAGAAEAEAGRPELRRSAPEDKAPSSVQAQRQEEKRLKSSLRSLEREEEQILARLDELDAERRRTEDLMARPEVYADGGRMRELRRAHQENARQHEEQNARWEEVAARIAELKAGLSAVRNDTVSR